MKKILVLVLAVAMVLSFAACKTTTDDAKKGMSESLLPAPKISSYTVNDDFKIGVILLHDEDSTYDNNFINGVKSVKEAFGLSDSQVILKRNIEEGDACYEAAKELAQGGCKVVFADSFGHEDYMIKAAKEFTDVQFCHATGTKAHTENLANYHNAFAAIYEGRYLAGIAAGLKLKEMGTYKNGVPTIGYVGAFTYAEVISGYTSFFLGAKSVVPNAVMKVQFTGSWYDEKEEKAAAQALINAGCDLISQHADSMGAPTACEDAGVPNVSYNGSTYDAGENTFIISSAINWAPYFELIIKAANEGKEIPTDWTGTIATGSVIITGINQDVAAEGTEDALKAAIEKFKAGTLHVFDTATFKLDGANLTSYMADVDTDAAFTPDKEVISDGYFHESEYRSAPYFDIRIDDITLINQKY